MQDRIDELESQLDDSEVMSDCYDYIRMRWIYFRIVLMQCRNWMICMMISLYKDYDDIDR